MIRRPPRSTLFPTRRSSDLASREVSDVPANFVARCRRHLLEIREKRARAIALEPEVDERMDGLPVRGFVGITLEKPHEVAACKIVRAGAPESVAEEKPRSTAFGRFRERAESRRFDEINEVADGFVSAPGYELVLDDRQIVTQPLRRERRGGGETAFFERTLIGHHRGALRVGRPRRARGGLGSRRLWPRGDGIVGFGARRFVDFAVVRLGG